MKIYPDRNLNSNGPRVTFHESGLINFNPLASDKLGLSILDRFVIDVEPNYIRFEKDQNGFPVRKKGADSNNYRFNSRVACCEIIKLFCKTRIKNVSFLIGEVNENYFELILPSIQDFGKEVSDAI